MLKCSHGLAYEIKCYACVSEALVTVKLNAIKTVPPKGIVAYKSAELRIIVDSVRACS
jgi:hypothetical protein